MKTTRIVLTLAAVALIPTAGPVAAQETKPEAGAAGMQMPKPGPEHELFRQDAGTWDATVEMFAGPDAAPMVSKGVETETVGCGGLCMISDFSGELAPGTVFHGHGTSAWDPAKKKYVGTWTDSMSAGIATGESTYDPATKTMTGWMEATDMSGKQVKSKAVTHYKDPDTRVFTMYQTGPDGKETMGMKITYVRRP